MRYIYDILANFNDIFFEFYEWNDDDNIIHIKKLPIIKVDVDFFHSVKYSNVFVDSSLIEKIYRKTDFFSVSKEKYSYVCCLCDGREAIIVNFGSNGCILGRSSMLLDEENEVIDICECMSVCKFDFVDKCSFVPVFKTRYEMYIHSVIMDKLECLGCDELCYLYFDCFDECESDVNYIIGRIKKEIDCNYLYNKINDFLSLISINK